MKKIFIISTSILLLAACGNNENIESNDPSGETEVTESDEDQNSEEEKNEKDAVDSEKSKLELTEEEAEEQVIEYIKETKPEIADFLSSYQFLIDEKDNKYQVRMFSPESGDEDIGSPLLSSYEIDRKTGDIAEIDLDSAEPEPYLSEVAIMSDEEREEHHRELATDEESLENSVLDNLLLPGLHENTETYEGKMNPNDDIELFLATADDPPYLERLDDIPDIDEDGYFVINLYPYDLSNKAFLRISINGDYSKAQTFDIPIFEAEEGMESISVSE